MADRSDKEPARYGPPDPQEVAASFAIATLLAPVAVATAGVFWGAVALLGGQWWWPLVPASAGVLWVATAPSYSAARYASSWLHLLQDLIGGGDPTRAVLVFAAATWPWSLAVGGLVLAAVLRSREARPAVSRQDPVARRRPHGLRWHWTRRRIARGRIRRHLAGGAAVLGVGEQGRVVAITEEDDAGHVLVLGATNTGKTTSLLTFLAHRLHRGRPLVMIDMKADPGVVDALRSLAAGAGLRFVLWSLNGPTVWNPLARGNATQRTDLIIGAETWTEPHYQRIAERYLQTVFHVLEQAVPVPGERTGSPRIDQVALWLNPERLSQARHHVDDLALRDRLLRLSDGLSPDERSAVRSLGNRLGVLAESVAGRWLHPPDRPYLTPTLDLAAAVTEGAVVLFSLDAGTYPQAAAKVGHWVLQDLKTVAAERLAASIATPVYVAVDEFSALSGPHLQALFARGRAAGLRAVLSTQEMADLVAVSPEFAAQIIGNTAVKILHRQDNPDSAELLSRVAGSRLGWAQSVHVTPAGPFARSRYSFEETDVPLVSHQDLQTLRRGEAVVIAKSARATRQVPVQRVTVVAAWSDRDRH